ncbi:MAG: hypothetical protein VB094_04135 [Oscillibacter sp.]|nr:hypothetical protein [Oscillibacter sp.]
METVTFIRHSPVFRISAAKSSSFSKIFNFFAKTAKNSLKSPLTGLSSEFPQNYFFSNRGQAVSKRSPGS